MLTLTLVPFVLAQELPPYDKHVSVTFSPIHLATSIVELTTEVRVGDKVGLAGIIGVGRPEGYNAHELGVQARYYLLGDFDHGMQLGAELLNLHITVPSGSISASGQGTAIGPFLGYKIAARVGFTFEIQLGAEYLFGGAKAEQDGDSIEVSSNQLIPC